MRALEPEVFDAVFAQIESLLPARPTNTRSGVTGHGCPTGSACGPCWSAWSPGAPGSTRSAWWVARSLTRPCAPGATSGSRPESSTPWPRPWSAPTRPRSGSISMTPWSTAPSTRHPAVGRARAKAQLTEASSAGSGRMATDEDGIPIGWVADRANRNDCVLLPATLEEVDARGCSKRSPPCTSTAATTTESCAAGGRTRHRRSRPRSGPSGTTSSPNPGPARAPLAGRAHQLVALELRPAPTQHRPQARPSQGPAGLRHRHLAHRQADRPQARDGG